ncbi:hypothetical protein IW261DRAFT_1597613 [Armillaria novae-zelandiae]|uniref:F-box domain-containing protein n=1 Tax=Armillaria novae-zelandiae TaxID=153914 RepID=A0AA39T829_9AGAR|nr:hypothetical protein IW261DRAFT_1597613 [Armillaria novae-zelandiae]
MNSFKWSTPERRSGNQELTLIPSEIYLEIFSYFEPSDEITEAQCKAAFSRLTFVCRFFCSVALPRLYKSVLFRGHKCESRKEEPVSFLKFCLEINKGSSWACNLTCHVTDCSFENWIPDSPSQRTLHTDFLRVYCKAMIKMEEIQSVTLVSVMISHRLLKSIAKLKKLKRLVVRDCELDQNFTQVDVSTFRSLPIEEFTLVFAHEMAPPSSSFELLQGVPKASDVVLDVRTWDNSSMSPVMNSQLTRLSLGTVLYETSLPQLAHVLNHLPSLTRLSIATLTVVSVRNPTADPAFPLTFSSLPCLRVLACPPLLAILFPKRALIELDITGHNKVTRIALSHVRFNASRHTVQTLARTTAAIHTLSICSDMVPYGDSIIQNFPYLRKLHITYEIREEGLTNVLENISTGFRNRGQGYLPIHELDIDFALINPWMVDLPIQRKAIGAYIEGMFPQVTRVDLGAGVQWHRGDIQSDWQAYVQPARIEGKLRRALEWFSNSIIDYKRCFAKAGLLDRD